LKLFKNPTKVTFLSIYIILLIAVLIFFNSKRPEEYSYSYDLSTYALENGIYDATTGVIGINDGLGTTENFASSDCTILPAGDYSVTIDYSATGDNRIHIYADTNLDEYMTLPAGDGETSFNFSVWPGTDIFRIIIGFNGGELLVRSVSLSSNVPMYSDFEYFMFLTVFLGILIPAVIWLLRRKYNFRKKNWITLGILSAITLLMSLPVFSDYMWLGIDTRPHLMRTEGVMMAINDHRLPTIIYSNYCNRYGLLSCIYPDKFLYLSGLLRHFNVSLLTAYNTTILLINIAAVSIMYFCSKHITKSNVAGILAAGLYCCIPYRIYVMYGGGQAFGMGLGMIFFAVVFTAIYDIFLLDGKKWYILPLGMVGILSSHVLSFALSCIICLITVIYCVIVLLKKGVSLKNQKKSFAALLKAVLISVFLGLSSIVPFVYYYAQGLSVDKMKLDFMMSIGTFKDNFASENGIFYIVLFVLIVLCLVLYKKKYADISACDSYYVPYMAFLLVLGYILFLASTNVFPWGILSKIGFVKSGLDYFQFGERFMLAGSAAVCIGFAMLAKPLIESGRIKKLSVNIGKIAIEYSYAAIGALLIFSSVLAIHKYNADIAWCGVLCPDRMTGNFYYREFGYLPAGTELSYFESPIPNCGDWDSVQNITYLRNGTTTHYEYICSSDNNYMEFPIFNYKGYHAYDADGNELPIINSEHNRITVNLTKSSDMQVIDVVFESHIMFKICAVISLISTLIFYAYILTKGLKLRIFKKSI